MSKEVKDKPAVASILDRAEEYVAALFQERLDPKFLFHNNSYAEELADQAGTLAKAANLDEKTTQRLILAARFYPTGYVGGHKGWPRRSADFLREFAGRHDFDAGPAPDWIPAAEDATDDSEREVKLLHDVVYNWLGRKRFDRRSDLLQLEQDALGMKDSDPIPFGVKLQELILNFKYLTPEGTDEYEERRRKNVSKQQQQNYKIRKDEVKVKTGKNFGRGIDTMYRTAFRNHINLSRIADGKANMMISINTIILSIVITISGAGLSFFEDLFFENPEFLVPIITLLLSSLTAVVFAVFSARPKVTEYRIKKKKLLNSDEASLLYFGNFLKIEKQDFIDYLARMKMDQSSLYDDLARDLYDLGQVLHRKYLLLTISYNTFVGGLALAVLSFLVVYLLNVL